MTEREIRPQEHAISGERRDDCGFCWPDERAPSHFPRFGRERIDLAPIVTTDHFRIVPDILPVHPDGTHLLLVPRGHALSFADMAHMRDEVGLAIAEASRKVGDELVMAEHGSVGEGGGGRSVAHAHLHLVGSGGFDVVSFMESRLKALGTRFERIHGADGSPARTLVHRFRQTGYLYVQQGRSAILAHETDGFRFPSMFNQASLGLLLTGVEVHWKKIWENEELAATSVARISSLIERCRI